MNALTREYWPVIKAWAIACALFLIAALTPQEGTPPLTGPEVAFYIVTTLIGVGLLIAWLRYMTGPTIQSKKPPYQDKLLTTWSYLWRLLLAVFLTSGLLIFALGTINKLTGSIYQLDPISGTLVWLLPTLLVILILFGRQRREKLRALTLWVPR